MAPPSSGTRSRYIPPVRQIKYCTNIHSSTVVMISRRNTPLGSSRRLLRPTPAFTLTTRMERGRRPTQSMDLAPSFSLQLWKLTTTAMLSQFSRTAFQLRTGGCSCQGLTSTMTWPGVLTVETTLPSQAPWLTNGGSHRRLSVTLSPNGHRQWTAPTLK